MFFEIWRWFLHHSDARIAFISHECMIRLIDTRLPRSVYFLSLCLDLCWAVFNKGGAGESLREFRYSGNMTVGSVKVFEKQIVGECCQMMAHFPLSFIVKFLSQLHSKRLWILSLALLKNWRDS